MKRASNSLSSSSLSASYLLCSPTICIALSTLDPCPRRSHSLQLTGLLKVVSQFTKCLFHDTTGVTEGLHSFAGMCVWGCVCVRAWMCACACVCVGVGVSMCVCWCGCECVCVLVWWVCIPQTVGSLYLYVCVVKSCWIRHLAGGTACSLPQAQFHFLSNRFRNRF